MLQTLLIQPGSTEFDALHRVQGTLDVPLSEQGQTEVKQTIDDVKHLSIEALYTAPCTSAEETGLAVAPSALLGVYVQGDGVFVVFLGRADTTVTVPGPDIAACAWMLPRDLRALPEAEVLRPRKFACILADLEAGNAGPAELVRDVGPEA